MAEDRLHCIDILRGIAITLMIIAHFFKYWMSPTYYYILGIYFISVDPMGTPGFVFVSGVAFAYAWQKDLAKNMPKKEFTLKNLSRTVVLGILAFGYNLFGVLLRGMHWEELWFWYILQTLLICRVLAMVVIRTPSWMRALLSVVIIAITPFILSALDPLQANDPFSAFLYHLLFAPLYANGILFYFPFYLIGTIVGENIYQISRLKPALPPVRKIIRYYILFGILYIVAGIGLGYQLVSEDFGYNILEFINTTSALNWSGIPLFLITNSYAFILYATGWHLLLTALFVSLADLKANRSQKRWKIEYFGQYSLTIYLGQYLLFIKTPQLTDVWIWLGLGCFVVFIWLLVYLIDHYTAGIYSLEQVMNTGSEYLFRRWIHQNTEGLWKKAFIIPHKTQDA